MGFGKIGCRKIGCRKINFRKNVPASNTWDLCYKTYYGRNERSFDRETMVLCYKTLITAYERFTDFSVAHSMNLYEKLMVMTTERPDKKGRYFERENLSVVTVIGSE